MSDFYIKKLDDYPILQIEISDLSGPLDLTGCTLVMNYRPIHDTQVTTNSIFISDAVNGIAQYFWSDADASTPGVYEMEIVVTYSNVSQITFPNDRTLKFEVIEHYGS